MQSSRVLINKKFQATCLFLKQTKSHWGCSPVKFVKFLRIPIFTNYYCFYQNTKGLKWFKYQSFYELREKHDLLRLPYQPTK